MVNGDLLVVVPDEVGPNAFALLSVVHHAIRAFVRPAHHLAECRPQALPSDLRRGRWPSATSRLPSPHRRASRRADFRLVPVYPSVINPLPQL